MMCMDDMINSILDELDTVNSIIIENTCSYCEYIDEFYEDLNINENIILCNNCIRLIFNNLVI